MTYEEVLKEHPEKAEIFKLEELLWEEELRPPFFFNFREDMRPVFGEDEDYSRVDWENYPFLIEIARVFPNKYAPLSVCFSRGEKPELLELLDATGAKDINDIKEEETVLYKDQTAEECIEIVRKYWEKYLATKEPVKPQEEPEEEDWD